MIEQKRGQYRIIRTDETESTVVLKPAIEVIRKIINAPQSLASVTLSRNDHGAEVVMMVDDTGMIDGKPVNDKATALAREAFGETYPHKIHGDVIIVNDEDFA